VAIASNSIVHPIRVLAQTTENFAAGKLSARAPIERKDEIGALAYAYNQMASQLQEIIGRLEQRVNDRTRDLENQTRRLHLAAEIARDAASARSLGSLLERSARLISSRFRFHHTGIFLLDQYRERAVLVASSSEAGRQLMEDPQWPRVGDFGVIGRSAASGEPRIVLDTDPGVEFFGREKLVSTRSELVLPLKAENSVIGVLDIHSDQSQAFNEDDIAIFQNLADQLATAIERARLLQELESSLKELESAHGRYTREGWNSLSDTSQMGSRGYRFDNIEMEPLSKLNDMEKEVLEAGVTLSTPAKNRAYL
jgi:two-component system nitrate/nitrite sensor histidine kinase NarX